jgi:hypothetical protein
MGSVDCDQDLNLTFTTKQLPKLETLHRSFVALGLQYQQRFGINLPPLNSSLILYRHIKRLAIPSTDTAHFFFTHDYELTCF